ncbi:MAG: amino acid permease [Halanaerobium sp.]
MGMVRKEHQLDRNISFFAAFSIGTGTMIGAGIFVLPNIALGNAGPAVIFSFLLGGLISMATAFSMAELATGMPKAGGSYYFISRSMGALIGTIIGIGTWMGLVFKGSFALVGLAEYLNILVPIPILIIAIFGGLILLYINYKGAENSGLLQNIIVIGLIIILSIFIVGGILNIKGENLSPFMPFGYGSILNTTGLIFVSFLGITQLGAISEEVKNPEKNLPRAFIASVGFVTFLYIGVMLVVSGLFPIGDIIDSHVPLIDAGQFLAGNAGKLALIAAGFFATVSTANAALLSSSRFPFAMGRDNLMPEWFVKIHDEYGTPFRSIIATGFTMIILIILFNVEQLAKLGSAFNILIFVLLNFSVIILRFNQQNWYEPDFRDPFYPFTQIFGIVGSLALLPSLGIMPMLFTAAVILIGIGWFVFYGQGQAMPKYNLFDMLEPEDIKETIGSESGKVLVPLSNPEHEIDLLNMANLFSDHILGMHVIKVPPQTGLAAARDSHQSRIYQEDLNLENKFDEFSKNHIANLEYLESFSHNIASAISRIANSDEINLTLIGCPDNIDSINSLDSVTEGILKSIKSHIGVFKGKFPKEINKIIVPFGGGDNSLYAFHLAREIAERIGTEITLLKIISPDLDAEKKEEQIKFVKEELNNYKEEFKIDYLIKENYSIEDTIIRESKKFDLMIIGDSNERFRKSVFGNITRKVSCNIETPTLVVRRYKKYSRESIFSKLNCIFKKDKDKKVEYNKPEY